MPGKSPAIAYTRAPETRGEPMAYEEKFSGLLAALRNAHSSGATSLIIAETWVIGDSYVEIIESLSRISAAGLALHITGEAGAGGSVSLAS